METFQLRIKHKQHNVEISSVNNEKIGGFFYFKHGHGPVVLNNAYQHSTFINNCLTHDLSTYNPEKNSLSFLIQLSQVFVADANFSS